MYLDIFSYSTFSSVTTNYLGQISFNTVVHNAAASAV